MQDDIITMDLHLPPLVSGTGLNHGTQTEPKRRQTSKYKAARERNRTLHLTQKTLLDWNKTLRKVKAAKRNTSIQTKANEPLSSLQRAPSTQHTSFC